MVSTRRGANLFSVCTEKHRLCPDHFLICSFEKRSLPILTWVRSLTSKKGPAPLTGGLGGGSQKKAHGTEWLGAGPRGGLCPKGCSGKAESQQGCAGRRVCQTGSVYGDRGSLGISGKGQRDSWSWKQKQGLSV